MLPLSPAGCPLGQPNSCRYLGRVRHEGMRASMLPFGQLRGCLYATNRGRVRSANSPPSTPSVRPEKYLAVSSAQQPQSSYAAPQRSVLAKCPSRKASSCTMGHQRDLAAVPPAPFSPRDPVRLGGRHRSDNPSRVARCRELCSSVLKLPTRDWNQSTPATSRAG